MTRDVEKGESRESSTAGGDGERARPGTGSSGTADAKSSEAAHPEVDEKGSRGGPEPGAELTWPDGGLEAWGNILGCTLISITAFGTW